MYRAVSQDRRCSYASGSLFKTARLMTLHQIGTVFDRASGIRLPARVESTRTSLVKQLVINGIEPEQVHATYPLFSTIRGSRCRLARRRLKLQLLVCPSVDLKYSGVSVVCKTAHRGCYAALPSFYSRWTGWCTMHRIVGSLQILLNMGHRTS